MFALCGRSTRLMELDQREPYFDFVSGVFPTKGAALNAMVQIWKNAKTSESLRSAKIGNGKLEINDDVNDGPVWYWIDEATTEEIANYV